MRSVIWSQLKKRVEAFFVPELSGRVQLRSTNYRKAHDQVGRGSITVDGDEVWSMSSDSFWNEERKRIDEVVATTTLSPAEAQEHVRPTLEREGIMGQRSYYESLEDYLNASIEDNLASENVLRRALAMIDHRTGTRRLARIDAASEHPMVRYFHELRTERNMR